MRRTDELLNMIKDAMGAKRAEDMTRAVIGAKAIIGDAIQPPGSARSTDAAKAYLSDLMWHACGRGKHPSRIALRTTEEESAFDVEVERLSAIALDAITEALAQAPDSE